MATQIKVTIGTTTNRTPYILSSDTTLKSALDEAGVDYINGSTNLDGATLKAGEINKTFDDFGVTEQCFLYNVVKADNA